jgi:hypothetical protein
MLARLPKDSARPKVPHNLRFDRAIRIASCSPTLDQLPLASVSHPPGTGRIDEAERRPVICPAVTCRSAAMRKIPASIPSHLVRDGAPRSKTLILCGFSSRKRSITPNGRTRSKAARFAQRTRIRIGSGRFDQHAAKSAIAQAAADRQSSIPVASLSRCAARGLCKLLIPTFAALHAPDWAETQPGLRMGSRGRSEGCRWGLRRGG